MPGERCEQVVSEESLVVAGDKPPTDKKAASGPLTILDELAMFNATADLRDAVEEMRKANTALREASKRYDAATEGGASETETTALYGKRAAAVVALSDAWKALEAQRNTWAAEYMHVRGVSRKTARARAVEESEVMIYGSAERAAEVKKSRRY